MKSVAKNIVVLGLGNILMRDEGIGVYVVERLQKQTAKFPNVEFIDAGTGEPCYVSPELLVRCREQWKAGAFR